MKRLIPVFWLAVTLAAACSSDPQTGAGSQAAVPPAAQAAAGASDPLPSWNEGPTKKAIGDFVASVTKEGSPEFVPVPERIATFDNDGTLWTEKPLPFQVLFAFDRVKALAPQQRGRQYGYDSRRHDARQREHANRRSDLRAIRCRFYTPKEGLFDGTWKLPDVELTN